MIYGFGAEIVPCSRYDIQVVDPTFPDLDNEGCYSPALKVATAEWGDIWSPFGTVNLVDIGKVVDKFKSIPYDPGPPESGAPPKVRALLRGNVPDYSVKVNFMDIAPAVNAFKTIEYAEDGPAHCTGACP